MAYTRRQVEDGVTIMNKELYDNLQDGIDELRTLANISNVVEATVDDTEE